MTSRYFPGRAPGVTRDNDGRSSSSSASSGAEDGQGRASTTHASCTALEQKWVTRSGAGAAPENAPGPARRRQRSAPVVIQPIRGDSRSREKGPQPTTLPPPPPPSRRDALVDDHAGAVKGRGEDLCQSATGTRRDDDVGDDDGGSQSRSESESGSEESSSEEDEAYGDMAALPKPVFVPKAARVTEQIRAARMDAERLEADRVEARGEARVEETRKQVADMLSREEMRMLTGGRENVDVSDFPDDTDGGEDAALQYSLWKVREIKRIKRDKDAADARAVDAVSSD